jgi:hypothetical protein
MKYMFDRSDKFYIDFYSSHKNFDFFSKYQVEIILKIHNSSVLNFSKKYLIFSKDELYSLLNTENWEQYIIYYLEFFDLTLLDDNKIKFTNITDNISIIKNNNIISDFINKCNVCLKIKNVVKNFCTNKNDDNHINKYVCLSCICNVDFIGLNNYTTNYYFKCFICCKDNYIFYDDCKSNLIMKYNLIFINY